MPYPISDQYMTSYYDSLPVSLVPDTNSFSIIIAIPLVHTPTLFEIYQIITLPVSQPDSNKAATYQTESQYLAISTDRNLFMHLDREE